MKLLGRKFRSDPFLYCFGSIKSTPSQSDFQLLLEVDGKNDVITASPTDHFSDLVNKVVEKLNIPRHFVHFIHNGRPLNLFDHSTTLRDFGTHMLQFVILQDYEYLQDNQNLSCELKESNNETI